MDLPNVTLLFQMVHFAIAYVLMRKFVFEPALQIIVAQESYKQNLEQKIIVAQAAYQDTIQQKQSRWNFMKDSLTALIPKFILTSRFKKTTSEPIALKTVQLSSEQKQKLAAVLQDELVDIKS